jgi:hypothetical protein
MVIAMANEMIDHIRQEFEEIRRSENPFDPQLECRNDGEYMNKDTWIAWRYFHIAKTRSIPKKAENPPNSFVVVPNNYNDLLSEFGELHRKYVELEGIIEAFDKKDAENKIKTVIPKGWVVLHTRENVMIEKQSQRLKLFLKDGEIDRERSVSPELAMRNFLIDLLDLHFEVGD